MPKQVYERKELTMSAGRANMLAFIFIIPLFFIYISSYYVVWPEHFTVQNLKYVSHTHSALIMYMPAIMLVLFVVGAVFHEMLHGFTWSIFCKHGLKSIKYGVHWKALTPYCHCKETLSLRSYMLGGAMPGFVMGVLPAIVGIVTGSFLMFLFGLFFTLAAAGDMLILWMLRNQKKEDMVQDHPERIGCYVFQKR